MKKKYSLAIGITICFLLCMVLSWIIPTATVADGVVTNGDTHAFGLFGLAYYPGLTIGTFIQFGLIILAIGGLYGVMAKTGVYAKLIEDFAKKFKGKEKLALILTIVFFALINSLTGVPFALLVIIPLFMEFLLKLGYKKITTVASTIGALLVGSLASTYGYNVAGSACSLLGISINNGILSRFILLVLVTTLFILFVLGNKDLNKESKKAKKDEDASLLFIEEKANSKKSTLPIKILFIITFIIGMISMFNWSLVFKLDIFEKFYENLMAIKIGDYPIMSNLLGLTNPFGYWDSYELVAILVIASLIIGWVYSLKIKDIFEGFIDGAKKLLKPAIYVTMANIVFTLMLSTNGSYMLTWIASKFANITEGFNLFAVSLSSIIGGFFFNHFYYLFNTLQSVFTIGDMAKYSSILMFIIQSIYGLVMLILPTSLFLVGGLTILDVSYKEWIKYIWRFLIQILIIVIVISVILVLAV